MVLENDPTTAPQKLAEESSLKVYTTLLEWIKSHGGNLHENVHLSSDDQRGTHLRVKCEGVPTNTHIIKTPIATSLSYFNVIDYSVGEVQFPAHGVNFPPVFVEKVGPEEAAIFFLVGQYLREAESFWYPYFRTLPQPGSLTTLPYYQGEEDLEWLEGTSLASARQQKIALLQNKYQRSHSELRKSGSGDAEKYSWDLYLWASTIFFSRAFSAKVLSGVIPELELPEENVSVLLPFLDISNHRPLAKVEWRAGKESIDFVVLEHVGAEQEIANNYGPRNNEQLMMNYGFCLAENPCDYRTVGLRAPPGSPLQIAREQQKRLFPDSSNDAEDPYYVFSVFYPLLSPDIPMEHSIFSPALFNAVSVLAANQRELETLEVSKHEIRVSDIYENSRAAIAAISQIIIELITHIVRLRVSGPEESKQPENLKQTHAKIYRDSQIRLSETALVIAAWTLQRARLHGLQGGWDETKQLLNNHMARISPGKFPQEVQSRTQVRILERPSLLTSSGELFTLPESLALLSVEIQTPLQECLKTISTTASRRISALRGIPQEASPFRFPLFACFVIAAHTTTRHNHSLPSGQRQRASPLPPRLSQWANFLLTHYPPPPSDVAWALEDEDDEALLSEFNEVLERMRERNTDALFSNLEPFITGVQGDDDDDDDDDDDAWWLSPNWLRWAWMMTEQECVQAPEDPLALLNSDGSGSGNVMLSTETYLYIPRE
ncbi:hypothetical protein BDW59DRAFT_178327 [Aspergillus cavernicola]|uniref:SET domain-containing protein n=1 Tax=Aspergillus cavernicola TaxID=176166 RepID=A0ABR4HCI5_9EURO